MREDDPLNCKRTMALKDFASWLADFASDRGARQERLIRTVERAFEVKGKGRKIVVKGPLVLRACLITRKKRESRANLADDQIKSSLPDRSE
jgi:hypothetical protein